MNISLNTVVPGFTMEPTMMFGYPTYLSDVYTAKVEQIYIPEEKVEPIPVEIRVSRKQTMASRKSSWKRELLNALVGSKSQEKGLDYSNYFVYDARFDTDKNVAHIMDNICTPLLLAQKLLSEHLGQSITIHAILPEKASALAQETYKTLRIPTICTNQKVYANVVELTPSLALDGVQPDVFNVDIPNYNSQTPERVFIARRGNRRLINNDEVSQFLAQRGFVTYYFEDFNTSEKWSIARNAKVVVAVHGAGTGNFIFNRDGLAASAPKGSGLKLIELFSPCYTIFTYRRFGAHLNGKWCAVRGQISPEVLRYLDFDKTPRDSERSPIRDPFKIDLESLQMALDYMEVETTKSCSKQLVGASAH